MQKITDNTVAIRSGIETRGSAPSGGSTPTGLSPPDATEVLKQLTRTRKKVESMEESLQNRLSVVANEVSSLLLFFRYVLKICYLNLYR